MVASLAVFWNLTALSCAPVSIFQTAARVYNSGGLVYQPIILLSFICAREYYLVVPVELGVGPIAKVSSGIAVTRLTFITRT
jgi:hypothetical protein